MVFDPKKVPAYRKVSLREMEDQKIPVCWRDDCAHILIPLNYCRRLTWHAPWKCTELRHAYEHCQYKRLKVREKEQMKIKLDKRLARQ